MALQAITELEQTELISYTRTVLGWYNITVDGQRYNVNPDLFSDIVYPSKQTVAGIAEVTKTELQALIGGGIAL